MCRPGYDAGPSPKETWTTTAEFRYQGGDEFTSGMIKLLAALNASGVKLSELRGHDHERGVFIQRGALTFRISGTQLEVERFKLAFNS